MKRILYDELEVEIDDGACERGLWKEEPRHPETLKFLHKKLCKMSKPTMLDIGAGQGRYTLLAKFIPGMTVFCWEPNPVALKYLRSNVCLNRLQESVKVFDCGVWYKTDRLRLYTHPMEWRFRSATMGEHPHKDQWDHVRVSVKKLDDFISWFKKVDLVKLDVEGAELMVLQGGRKVFKKWKPPIFLEWMEKAMWMFSYRLGALEELLRSWGYKNFTPIPPYDMWVTI